MIKGSDSYSPHRSGTGHLLQLGFFVAAISLSALTSSAQTIEMTKIVFRRIDPKLADSSAAKPTTIYLAAEKYTRVENAPDPAQGKQILIITKEPDNWMINLADHTARHVLDPGPTFVARSPIMWHPKPPGEPDPDEAFRGLEFGNEATFFRQNSPRDLGERKLDGKNAKAFAIKSGAREATLFLDPETSKPLQLDVTRDGKADFSISYLSYQTDLPFDPALFELPEGLKITEAK
jgi:hypothetical protein